MASSVKDMLAAANSAVPRIQPADLRDRMSKGDVVLVDVRDAPELATGGKIKGAVHVPRGMLEFRADSEEVVISKEVVEGTARPLYIYADRADRTGDASAS